MPNVGVTAVSISVVGRALKSGDASPVDHNICDSAHFFKNGTLSCPTGGMLPRAACHWLTKSEFASYWLTQSATYSILPPAQASCCSTLDMLSSYIVRGTVRHKFALTFRTEI